MNIDTDFNIDNLTLVQYLKSIESPFLANITEVYKVVKVILNNRTQYIFPNYTLHNVGHSLRVAEYMSKLVDDYTKLSELEITLLIYSALLHDIGMAVSQEDINAIKNDSFHFCDVKNIAVEIIFNQTKIHSV